MIPPAFYSHLFMTTLFVACPVSAEYEQKQDAIKYSVGQDHGKSQQDPLHAILIYERENDQSKLKTAPAQDGIRHQAAHRAQRTDRTE